MYQLTFLLECEVLCQMPAFMISSQKEQSSGIAEFQGPQVQYTLNKLIVSGPTGTVHT